MRVITIDQFRKYFPDGKDNIFTHSRENAFTKKELMTKIKELEGVKISDNTFNKLIREYTPQGRIVVIKQNQMTRKEREKWGRCNRFYSQPAPPPIPMNFSPVFVRVSKYELPLRWDGGEKPVKRERGEVSVAVVNLHKEPLKVRLYLYPYLDDHPMDVEFPEKYVGHQLWELKPSSHLSDCISLPIPAGVESPDVRIGLYWSVVDSEEKEWERLHCSFLFHEEKDWIFSGEMGGESV